jgi:integrase/recombinase XerC
MLDSLLRRPGVIARWSSGTFGPYLEPFAAYLRDRGLKPDSILDRLRAVNALGRWLCDRRLTAADLDDDLIARFVDASRCERSGTVSKNVAGLRPFLQLVREHGGGVRIDASPDSQADAFVAEYLAYLDHCLGLAPSTRRVHRRYAFAFIAARFGNGPLEWSSLTADDVVAFVLKQARHRTGHGPKLPANSLRVLLRFLIVRGLVRDGLQGAVPSIRTFTMASLPERLTAEEVDRAIDAWTSVPGAQGLRNRAILLLLARLGLRANEVRHLRLDDIDWSEGRLLIRSEKTRCERILPLSHDVGSALAAYLKAGRPPSSHRHVFLTLRPPRGPIQESSAISSVVRSSFKRAGLLSHARGAHSLRHTIASEMVCAGATFKDVADVLGHRSLATTEIYAKLDLVALSRIALPWPGGAK